MDRRAYPFSNKSFRPHRLFRRNDFTSKSHPTSYAKTSLQHMYKYAWTYHIRHYSDPSPFLLNSELARNSGGPEIGIDLEWVAAGFGLGDDSFRVHKKVQYCYRY